MHPLDQISYCDRCATVEKRVRKRGATLCKIPLIHKGLAAKEVGHIGWRSTTPKLLHRSFLKLRLDQNNWETLLPMSAACGQHLGCRTSMVSIQLQRIWKEYTDVILLCICGDWAFAIMLFLVLFFSFLFFNLENASSDVLPSEVACFSMRRLFSLCTGMVWGLPSQLCYPWAVIDICIS